MEGAGLAVEINNSNNDVEMKSVSSSVDSVGGSDAESDFDEESDDEVQQQEKYEVSPPYEADTEAEALDDPINSACYSIVAVNRRLVEGLDVGRRNRDWIRIQSSSNYAGAFSFPGSAGILFDCFKLDELKELYGDLTRLVFDISNGQSSSLLQFWNEISLKNIDWLMWFAAFNDTIIHANDKEKSDENQRIIGLVVANIYVMLASVSGRMAPDHLEGTKLKSLLHYNILNKCEKLLKTYLPKELLKKRREETQEYADEIYFYAQHLLRRVMLIPFLHKERKAIIFDDKISYMVIKCAVLAIYRCGIMFEKNYELQYDLQERLHSNSNLLSSAKFGVTWIVERERKLYEENKIFGIDRNLSRKLMNVFLGSMCIVTLYNEENIVYNSPTPNVVKNRADGWGSFLMSTISACWNELTQMDEIAENNKNIDFQYKSCMGIKLIGQLMVKYLSDAPTFLLARQSILLLSNKFFNLLGENTHHQYSFILLMQKLSRGKRLADLLNSMDFFVNIWTQNVKLPQRYVLNDFSGAESTQEITLLIISRCIQVESAQGRTLAVKAVTALCQCYLDTMDENLKLALVQPRKGCPSIRDFAKIITRESEDVNTRVRQSTMNAIDKLIQVSNSLINQPSFQKFLHLRTRDPANFIRKQYVQIIFNLVENMKNVKCTKFAVPILVSLAADEDVSENGVRALAISRMIDMVILPLTDDNIDFDSDKVQTAWQVVVSCSDNLTSGMANPLEDVIEAAWRDKSAHKGFNNMARFLTGIALAEDGEIIQHCDSTECAAACNILCILSRYGVKGLDITKIMEYHLDLSIALSEGVPQHSENLRTVHNKLNLIVIQSAKKIDTDQAEEYLNKFKMLFASVDAEICVSVIRLIRALYERIYGDGDSDRKEKKKGDIRAERNAQMAKTNPQFVEFAKQQVEEENDFLKKFFVDPQSIEYFNKGIGVKVIRAIRILSELLIEWPEMPRAMKKAVEANALSLCTFEKSKGEVRDYDQNLRNFVKKTYSLRQNGLMALGKICLTNGDLARIHVDNFQPFLRGNHEPDGLRCVVLVVLMDLLKCHTDYLEQFIPKLTACIGDPKSSMRLRETAVTKLQSLLAGNTLLWDGPYLFELLSAAAPTASNSFECRTTRRPLHAEIENLLSPLAQQDRQFWVSIFFRALCFFNNCTKFDHYTDASMGRERKYNFPLSSRKYASARQHVLKYIIGKMRDPQKYMVFRKFFEEIIFAVNSNHWGILKNMDESLEEVVYDGLNVLVSDEADLAIFGKKVEELEVPEGEERVLEGAQEETGKAKQELAEAKETWKKALRAVVTRIIIVQLISLYTKVERSPRITNCILDFFSKFLTKKTCCLTESEFYAAVNCSSGINPRQIKQFRALMRYHECIKPRTEKGKNAETATAQKVMFNIHTGADKNAAQKTDVENVEAEPVDIVPQEGTKPTENATFTTPKKSTLNSNPATPNNMLVSTPEPTTPLSQGKTPTPESPIQTRLSSRNLRKTVEKLEASMHEYLSSESSGLIRNRLSLSEYESMSVGSPSARRSKRKRQATEVGDIIASEFDMDITQGGPLVSTPMKGEAPTLNWKESAIPNRMATTRKR